MGTQMNAGWDAVNTLIPPIRRPNNDDDAMSARACGSISSIVMGTSHMGTRMGTGAHQKYLWAVAARVRTTKSSQKPHRNDSLFRPRVVFPIRIDYRRGWPSLFIWHRY